MFNPTAEQTVTTRLNGKTVEHVLAPIGDEAFLDFLERGEKLEHDDTCVLFYDTFAKGLRGLKGELPANWKELLPRTEKCYVALRTILSVHFLTPDGDAADEVKDEDGLSFSDYLAIDRNLRTYHLRTYWDGEKVTLPLTLRLFTAKERKDLLRVLQKETATNRYQTEYAAKAARAALIGQAEWLPVNLLSSLAIQHLAFDSLVIEKN